MIHPDPIVVYPHGSPGDSSRACGNPFHRADNAGWRAIQAVPEAVQVFDMSKQLENLVGQIEGVILLRGVGELLDERPFNIRTPGGTRKIAHLSGSP